MKDEKDEKVEKAKMEWRMDFGSFTVEQRRSSDRSCVVPQNVNETCSQIRRFQRFGRFKRNLCNIKLEIRRLPP